MDKKELLKARSAKSRTEEVALDDDFVVTVRALTRDEVKECTGTTDVDESKIKSRKDVEALVDKADRKKAEIKLISKSLVDPEMSEEDVAEWLAGAPAGDSVRVMDAVSRLSGLSEDARKSSVSNVRVRKPRR